MNLLLLCLCIYNSLVHTHAQTIRSVWLRLYSVFKLIIRCSGWDWIAAVSWCVMFDTCVCNEVIRFTDNFSCQKQRRSVSIEFRLVFASTNPVMHCDNFVRGSSACPCVREQKAQFKRNVREKWKNAVRLFRAVQILTQNETPQQAKGKRCAKAFAFVYNWLEHDVA